VHAAKPDNVDKYQLISKQGLNFYLSPELAEKKLKVYRVGWWIFSHLTVQVIN